MTTEGCATDFPHYKVPLTFRYSRKRLRNRRSKNLMKFSQVYIAFVLWYVLCFEKKNTYWLNESWKTRLPKSWKCTITIDLYCTHCTINFGNIKSCKHLLIYSLLKQEQNWRTTIHNTGINVNQKIKSKSLFSVRARATFLFCFTFTAIVLKEMQLHVQPNVLG